MLAAVGVEPLLTQRILVQRLLALAEERTLIHQRRRLDALLQEGRILGQGWCLTVLAVQPFHLLLG